MQCIFSVWLGAQCVVWGWLQPPSLLLSASGSPSPIHFELKKIPFRPENSETPARNARGSNHYSTTALME